MRGLKRNIGCKGGWVTSNKITQRVYEILEGEKNDKSTKIFQAFIISLISINVLVVIIETEESVLDQYGYLFTPFEIFSIMIFTGEYGARLLVYRKNPKYQNSRFGLIRFILTPMMLVDLSAILPFFLPFVVADLRIIRIIRLLRLFRLFKLARYSDPMKTLGEVIKAKIGDLAVAFFILFIVLIFASSLMYYAENQAQPEIFSSIPASMWWGIITLTTIGYGDTYPVTVIGKIIGAGVALIGIAVYAIPTGIMASAFTEQLRKRKEGQNKCPHCGKELPE